jgi:hypothetical protein
MRSRIACGTFILLYLMSFVARAQSASDSSQPKDQAEITPSAHNAPSRPSEDWNRVHDLTHDEQISVWASHNRHVRCLFTGATDDYLFCEPAFSRWHSSQGEYRFTRADVDKVRLEQSERNFKATVIATGVAGAIAGSALTNGKNGSRVLGDLFGGLGGTVAGLIIGLPVAAFVPGTLVYERPRTQSGHARSRNAQPVPPQPEPRESISSAADLGER